MIFVSTGTSAWPFQRLVDAAARLAAYGEVVLQYGAARPPSAGVTFAYAEETAIAALVRRAETVVCHGGCGSVALALSLGHRAIVLPRLAELGENIDDHQVAFCERLARDGLITLCSDVDQLLHHCTRRPLPATQLTPSPRLVAAINDAIATAHPERVRRVPEAVEPKRGVRVG